MSGFVIVRYTRSYEDKGETVTEQITEKRFPRKEKKDPEISKQVIKRKTIEEVSPVEN